jgi:ribosomal protein L37AE/L43A
VSTAEAGHPVWCPTDPTEAESCPECGATHGVQRITGTSPKVQAWTCTGCGLDFAVTVINPTLRAEVTRRAQTREHAMATVDTTLWRCRICGQEGTARTTPQATDDAIAHLGIDHGGVDCASECKHTP